MFTQEFQLSAKSEPQTKPPDGTKEHMCLNFLAVVTFLKEGTFMFRVELRARYRDFLNTPSCPQIHNTSTPLIRGVNLLYLMKSHGHIIRIRIRSVYFSLGLPLGVVPSVGLDNCAVTSIHHYRITEYFYCPKIPRPPPPAHRNH